MRKKILTFIIKKSKRGDSQLYSMRTVEKHVFFYKDHHGKITILHGQILL
jgi:hypothetical protein